MTNLIGLKDRVNFKAIFLFLLFLILLLRFSIKMLNDYPAWDFFPTYYAAKDIFARGDIYRDHGISAVYSRSPAFAFILSPIGFLPRNIASFLWCLLNIFSLGMIFIISEKIFVKDVKEKRLFWIFAAPLAIIFISRPLISEFLLGQVDILMLALVMLALFYKERNKIILSALFFVIAASIKLTPLIFLLYFLFKKEIKLIAWAVFFMLVFIFLPAIFLSWGYNLKLLIDWFHSLNVLYPHEATTPKDCWYQSLYFFFKRFIFGDKFNLSILQVTPKFAQYLNYLFFLAVSAFIFLRPKNAPAHNTLFRIIDYNLLIVSMVIFSPLAADYTYINFVVPIVFLVFLFREEKLYLHLRFCVPAALFLILNFFTGKKAFRLIGISSIQGETNCYLVVMTLAWQALIIIYLLFFLKYRFYQKGVR